MMRVVDHHRVALGVHTRGDGPDHVVPVPGVDVVVVEWDIGEFYIGLGGGDVGKCGEHWVLKGNIG